MAYYNYPINVEVSHPCWIYNLQRAELDESPFEHLNIYNMYRKDTEEVTNTMLEEQVLSPGTFKISYPYITGMKDDKLQAQINSTIIDMVSNLLRETVLLPEKIDFEDVIGFYKVHLNEKGILSILYGLYTYVERAAHGFTAYSSIMIDLETGKVYKLYELFNPKVNYKAFLEPLARKYIEENQVPLLTEYKGIKDDQEFYLTSDSLVIYYQVYEYTPYVYGLFEIKIPYTDILNILGPTSPIQRLIKY